MAINDSEKVDFLFKKVGYELTKTAAASQKTPDNESRPSPIVINSKNLWLAEIPSTPPAEDTSDIQRVFAELTPDDTSPISTNGNRKLTWLANDGDWINSSYGIGYNIQVYVGNTGLTVDDIGTANMTRILPAGLNNGDAFIFDYISGSVHFAENNVPLIMRNNSKVLYIYGYRYVGDKGSEGIALKTLDLTQFANTPASGLQSIINETTGSGDLVFHSGANLVDTSFSGGIDVSGNSIFYNDVNISGNLVLQGTGIQFEQATVTLYDLYVSNSGYFGKALTVGGTGVSLQGHQHTYSDITNFCDGVASCVDTELHGTSGVSLVYDNSKLNVVLTGEALAQHQLNTTGFVSRSGTNTYVTRSIKGGSNIAVNNEDGKLGDPTVSLSGVVSGLESVTATTFYGDLTGNASSSSQSDAIKTVVSSGNATYYLTFVDGNNQTAAYESVYTGAGLYYNPSNSGLTIGKNLVVGGDLTVNGNTVITNVDSMVIEDPIVVIGKPSGTLASEQKDRGIQFVYPTGNSTVPATGFFGFAKTAKEFFAASDVTISNEVVTVNNNSYLDAKFKDIDGATITAGSQFSGPGSGLSGTADNLEAGKAKSLSGGSTGGMPYQSSADTTTFLSIGTTGQFLRVNNDATGPYWDTVNYAELDNLPTIGEGTLTIQTSGVGISLGTTTTFGANQTSDGTITINSNATSANTGGTIVSRDSLGNFIAGTISGNLSGTATNALNIEVDTSTSNMNYLVFVSGTDGNHKPYVNNNLKFDASNNTLYGTDYSTTTTATCKIEYFIIDGGTP